MSIIPIPEVSEEYSPCPPKTTLNNRIKKLSKPVWGDLYPMVHDWGRLEPSHLFIFSKEEILNPSAAITAHKETKVDYDMLPFSDFCYTLTLNVNKTKDEPAFKQYHKFLVRVMDRNENEFLVGVYMKHPDGFYDMKVIFTFLKKDRIAGQAWYRHKKNTDEQGVKEAILDMGHRAIESMKEFLYKFQTHSVTIDDSPARQYKVSKLPPSEQRKQYHYTIDLNKKRKVPLFRQRKKSDTPTRMGRHERIGHTRTYKSGKVIFIEAYEVSKDMPWAQNSKRYRL